MIKDDRFRDVHALAVRLNLTFEHYPDAYPDGVVSCEEAARARGVNLSQELKHLILDTSKGEIMAHIPGDVRVSLRKVKRFLNTRRVHLLDLRNCPSMEPGTICPFIEPFWSYYHLIDKTVLESELMTTNDATLHGYLRFSPHLLLLAKDTVVGDFKKTARTTITDPRTAQHSRAGEREKPPKRT